MSPAGQWPGRLEFPDILAEVHLCLIETCHLGVTLDDRFELSMAGDLIEVCKPVGCPLLDHVDDTLSTASAVVLDDLGRHRQARRFIRLERHHNILRLGQERCHAARIQDRLTRPVSTHRIHGMRRIPEQRHTTE
jgi:hypothetical protein